MLKKKDILYPELSYNIVGCLFDVQNTIGHGHKEKVYESAVAEAFRQKGIKYEEQLYVPVVFGEKNVGRYYFDFLVENKIVVELKVGDKYTKRDIEQVLCYLRVNGISLGIIARFTSRGVIIKRIVNSDDSSKVNRKPEAER